MAPLPMAGQTKAPGWPLWGYPELHGSSGGWGGTTISAQGRKTPVPVPGLELGKKTTPVGLLGAALWVPGTGGLLPSPEWLFLLTPPCFLSQVQN